MRPCHKQSQISAHFDGNHTVEPYIRHPRMADLSKTRAGCAIRSTSEKLPKKSFGVSQAQRVSRIRSFYCHHINSPETRFLEARIVSRIGHAGLLLDEHNSSMSGCERVVAGFPSYSNVIRTQRIYRPHHAHAYASTRGSAPALSTPVFASMMMAALDARDQGGATRNL